MEFLNAVSAEFSPQLVSLLLTIAFVVAIFAVLSVRSAFVKTEKGKALLQWWELVDDYAEGAIVEVATTPQEREDARKLAEKYSLELGRPIDWRMALVLFKLENYVAKYIPFKLHLMELYIHAEHIYFQIQGDLNATNRKDVDVTVEID